MVNDGDFPTKSRKVPPADSALNFYQEEVIGNKIDVAVTTPGTTKSIVAMGKGTLNQLNTIIGMLNKNFTCDRNNVAMVDVDNTARFAISIIDNDSGPVVSANITAGTITITRYRAGTPTVIVNAAACSKADGLVYYDYTFVTASWQTDDSYLVDVDGQEFTIGGTSFYPSISPWFGFIGDISTIEGKIDTIDTEVGVIDGIVDMIKSAQHAGATIHFVGDGGNDAWDGLTWATRLLTLAQADTNASAGDLVLVGIYTTSASVIFATTKVTYIGIGLESTWVGGANTWPAGTILKNMTLDGAQTLASGCKASECQLYAATGAPAAILAGSNIIVEKNVIIASNVDALTGTSGSKIVIKDNDIFGDGTNDGISLGNGVSGSIVSGNRLNGLGGGVGVVTGTGGTIAVENNTIAGFTTPITLGDATDSQAGNLIPSTITVGNTISDDLKEIYDEAVAVGTDVDEIPSEANAKTFNATALASIEAEATDALEADYLDHFLMLDGATQKYPENCETDSILAKILVKADPAVPDQFDNSTDSLEAIRDRMDALNVADQIDLDAIIVDTTAIKAVTDVLPDAGALTSLAQDSTVAKEATLGTPVSDIYTEMAKVGADGDTLETLSDQLDAVALEASLVPKESQATFFSDIQPTAIIPAVAADLDFPSVTIPNGEITGTIVSVKALVKWRKQVDSSGSANAIDGASKTIRVKKSTGAWGTDDVVAIDVPDNTLATDASATEGGDIIVGDNEISSEVDEDNATYNFRSEETNRSDAIVVDGASLTLYDVQTALIVRWK